MKPLAVLDLETDPFEHGEMIYPFVAGFYVDQKFISFWGDDCVLKLVDYLADLKPAHIIYAHNGGRFDFFYFMNHLHREMRIVNSRVIQAKLGRHELRDSFAIMPFPLAAYQKTEINYSRFKRNRREKYRQEIVSYLRDDCRDLFTLCESFRAEFGDALTIGSASMRELKKFHQFRQGNGKFDANFRDKFYFGGRNQVFESGVINTPIKVFDVNSMYPHVMRSFLHPVSTGIHRGRSIQDNTCFVSVEGWNDGAFPVRRKDHSLDFTEPFGVFHTTIHEFNTALETRSFRPKRIIETLGFSERITFDAFVDHFYNARRVAKEAGDKIKTIFYKFVLNSSYGKFAQNPTHYSDYFIAPIGEFPDSWHVCKNSCEIPCRLRWSPSFLCNNYIIWSRPLQQENFFNIATGASITGAARAVLLKGLSNARRPLYCDTDSIICSDLVHTPLGDGDLGSWKLEATGTHAAICGKKLYAIFDGETCVKKAHKGAILTADQILAIANGAEIEARNPVPSFSWDGTYSFTRRLIRATA